MSPVSKKKLNQYFSGCGASNIYARLYSKYVFILDYLDDEIGISSQSKAELEMLKEGNDKNLFIGLIVDDIQHHEDLFQLSNTCANSVFNDIRANNWEPIGGNDVE